MLGFSLLLLASTPPMIEAVPCEDCPPPRPRTEIAALHIEAAEEIYRPYFSCYWEKLRSDPKFGVAELAEARAALVTARDSCISFRTSADAEMDRMLASKKIYGDATQIEVLRETFRQRGAVIFMYITASATGVRDEYLATMNAATGGAAK